MAALAVPRYRQPTRRGAEAGRGGHLRREIDDRRGRDRHAGVLDLSPVGWLALSVNNCRVPIGNERPLSLGSNCPGAPAQCR